METLPKSTSFFHATLVSSSSIQNIIVVVKSENKVWWLLQLFEFSSYMHVWEV